jgi:hypothetical protein
MRRQDTQRLDPRLALTRAPERQRSAHVGMVAQMSTWAAPCGVLGACEKEHGTIAQAALLLASRCGTVVAVVPGQVDSRSSPQRTAFPGGNSRK